MTVNDTTSLVETVGQLNPRLTVIDIDLMRGDIGTFLQNLHRSCPSTKILLIGCLNEVGFMNSLLNAGADSFVLRQTIATEILPAVEALAWNTAECFLRTRQKTSGLVSIAIADIDAPGVAAGARLVGVVQEVGGVDRLVRGPRIRNGPRL